MISSLPKAINCRLGVDDTDIKDDLSKYSDKTARVKALYRLGLQLEAMERNTTLIPDKMTASVYRVFIQDARKRNVSEAPIPVLYTSLS